MEFNNKTILISGLIIASFLAMYLNYEQIALAIVSGLVGYLSKDAIGVNDSVNHGDVVSVGDDVVPLSDEECQSDESCQDYEECC